MAWEPFKTPAVSEAVLRDRIDAAVRRRGHVVKIRLHGPNMLYLRRRSQIERGYEMSVDEVVTKLVQSLGPPGSARPFVVEIFYSSNPKEMGGDDGRHTICRVSVGGPLAEEERP